MTAMDEENYVVDNKNLLTQDSEIIENPLISIKHSLRLNAKTKLKNHTIWMVAGAAVIGFTLLIIGSVLIHKSRNKEPLVVKNEEGVPLSEAGVSLFV